MEILIMIIISFITSLTVCNFVTIHYLEKQERDWNELFDKMKNITIDEIKKYNN